MNSPSSSPTYEHNNNQTQGISGFCDHRLLSIPFTLFPCPRPNLTSWLVCMMAELHAVQNLFRYGPFWIGKSGEISNVFHHFCTFMRYLFALGSCRLPDQFSGAGSMPFSEEISSKLMAPVNEGDVEIKPEGKRSSGNVWSGCSGGCAETT